MPGFDLHTHSLHSDGTTTIAQNVADAVELGLEGLAITDHDTTTGFDEAFSAAEGTDLEILPGVEFSAELDASSVHVLGFWVDPANADLQTEMDRLRNERERRAEQIIEKFNALGIPASIDRVREIAGEAPLGRPHIAKAVLETGKVADTQEVFDKYLADGGPAYVPKYAVSPVRAVELLTNAGGVAVVAHPGLFGSRNQDEAGLSADAIEEMVAAGMAGIEAGHPDHTDANTQLYRDLAKAHGLVITAGSDYHGEAKENRLGSATTSRQQVEELRARR